MVKWQKYASVRGVKGAYKVETSKIWWTRNFTHCSHCFDGGLIQNIFKVTFTYLYPHPTPHGGGAFVTSDFPIASQVAVFSSYFVDS